MTNTFDYRNVIKKTEEVKKAREERLQSSGVQGVHNLYMAENTQKTVRFLHPYDIAIDLWIHSVPVPGSKRPFQYICQSQFSSDSMAHCPICADMDNEQLDEKMRKGFKPRRLKHFLVYVYDNENKTFPDSNGNQVKASPVCVYALGPGDMNEKNWLALAGIETSFGSLSLIDIHISRTGTGLDTVISFVGKPVPTPQPNGTVVLTTSPFELTRIDPTVLQVLPQIPPATFKFDGSDAAYDLCSTWGDFFIRAGRYKMPETYKTPDSRFIQSPNPDTSFYSQQAPAYQQVPFNPYQQQQTPLNPYQQAVYQQTTQVAAPYQQQMQPPYQQPQQAVQPPQQNYVMPANEPTPQTAWD